jgi:hypothetical protein
VHTLFLLLACSQNKHRRGRFYFQEREDDMDMNTSDTTKSAVCRLIFQVNSSSICKIYYFIIQVSNTTPSVVLYRFIKDMYNPHVKMREDAQNCLYLNKSSLVTVSWVYILQACTCKARTNVTTCKIDNLIWCAPEACWSKRNSMPSM